MGIRHYAHRGWPALGVLAVVLDLYSRQVIGWALAPQMCETLTIEALEEAAGRRDIESGLLLDSGRGVQYRGNEYRQGLRDLEIVPRMRRKRKCRDNAVMEASLAQLKARLIYPEDFQPLEALRAGLFEFIEIFYNRQHRHSSLDYVSPAV